MKNHMWTDSDGDVGRIQPGAYGTFSRHSDIVATLSVEDPEGHEQMVYISDAVAKKLRKFLKQARREQQRVNG